VIQGDWYLVAQLPKFKNGLRGAHKDDTVGMQMRAFAATLPDEQAYADVVSYITSLAK
jgi:cytochrome c oxidase subunit 2